MTEAVPRLQAAQDYLAAETLRNWKTRRITITSPVAVPWDRRSGRVFVLEQPLQRGRPVGEARLAIREVPTEGDVTQLREQVYDQAGWDPKRISVRGDSGTGKTTAMQLLMLDVLRHRADDEPVPVWLDCREWDPHSTGLLAWVAATMVRDCPGLVAAAELVDQRRVALFLDGLDDLPLAARARALALIHQESGKLRVVLAGRAAEYTAAHRIAFQEPTSYFSTGVRLRPVGVPAAETFLLAGQSGARRAAWQQVIDRLHERPRSVAVRTFADPLALSLARETYAGPDTDPIDLLDEQAFSTPDALLQHLLSRPLVLAEPDNRVDRVSPPGRIARLLSWLRALPGRAGRAIAGRRRTLAFRWSTRDEFRDSRNLGRSFWLLIVASIGIVGGLALGIVSGIVLAFTSGAGHGIVGGIAVWIGFALAVAILTKIMYWIVALQEIFSSSRPDH